MLHIVTIQSTGESLLFLASASMINNCKTGECQKNDRQSDSFIVPKRLGNANGGKGGYIIMVFLRTHQLYSGTEVLMETKLERIAEISANLPRPEFTTLYYLINKEMLLQCHKELDGNKAVGIDEITKKEYERNLEQNIDGLVERLKRKAYKPQPSIRVYIPKSNGKLRPLGIVCYEDKIVQLALKKILEAIYEPRFLNCMYGFRPNRGCHGAIKE